LADTDISRQTVGHSFGGHLISESVSGTSSSVIEASIALFCVFMTRVSQCPVNLRSEHPTEAWVLRRKFSVSRYRHYKELQTQKQSLLYAVFVYFCANHPVQMETTFLNEICCPKLFYLLWGLAPVLKSLDCVILTGYGFKVRVFHLACYLEITLRMENKFANSNAE
jgi:hypothetical protein